jgi:hypothetical protein
MVKIPLLLLLLLQVLLLLLLLEQRKGGWNKASTPSKVHSGACARTAISSCRIKCSGTGR